MSPASCYRLHIPVLIIFTVKMFLLQAYERKCHSFFDCGGRPCCTVSFNPLIKVCRNKTYNNCVGMACLHDGNCAGDRECCDNNVCTNDAEICGCKHVRDHVCKDDDRICCIPLLHSNQTRLCKRKCEYHPCSADYQCGKDECCDRNTCSSNCTRLRECGVDSDCSSTLKCCEHSDKIKRIKICLPECTNKHCITDGDCVGLSQCCGDDKLCTNCRNSANSLTNFVITSCVLLFVIICSVLILTVCCRRRGRCVFFKPRMEEERFDLSRETEAENDAPNEHRPPPPYSILHQPFPASQNQEFPPLYKPRDI